MKIFSRPLTKALLILLAIALILIFTDKNRQKESTSDGFNTEKVLSLYLIQYNDSPLSEMSEKGIIDGLASNGLIRDQHYTLQISNAQGDIAALNLMIDAARNAEPDLVFVTSTPTLQVAAKKIQNIPLVFSVVADPIVAGVGTSFSDHLPNVTGISTLGDYGGMISLLKIMLPQIKTIGTLFSPGEANSIKNMNDLKKYAEAANITLLTVPINSGTEVTDAAMSLAGQHPDAICQVVDNLTSASFSGIQKAAQNARIPLFAFVSEQARQGAMMVVSRDYHQAGVDAVRLAMRVFQGEKVENIPFEFVSKTDILINPKAAEFYGVKIPESFYQKENVIVID